MTVVLRPRSLTAASAAADAWLPRIGYQNYARGLPTSSVLVSSEDPSAPRDAVLRPDTGEFWQALSLPATCRIDLGETKTIDYVGLVADLGTCKTGVKVETSLDALTYTTFASEDLPSGNTPLMFVDAARQARFLRLTLSAGSPLSTPPPVAAVYCGNLLVMQRGLQLGFSPPNLARQTELNSAMSRGGQFLGQTFRSGGVVCSPSFSNLDEDWYRTFFEPFVKSAKRFPYFFAWQKQNFSREVAYGWTTQNFKPAYSQIDRVSISWEMVGIGGEED